MNVNVIATTMYTAAATLSVGALAGPNGSTCIRDAEPQVVNASWGGSYENIVATAVEAGSFETLVAAVKAAGLAGALQGDGPFTVFAPTDEAFAKLPAGTVESLLEPENRGTLQAILKYHVVPGEVKANQVVNLDGATTLNGQRVDISTSYGEVRVDGAQVVKTDIKCSNGVIHVVDSVLMPAQDNIVETAGKAGSFTTLLTAAKAAGLVPALTGEGPLTVFAPTDDAFAKLPNGTVESLLQSQNRHKLAEILKLHVVSGRVYSDAAARLDEAETLAGEAIDIRTRRGGLYVGGAEVIDADIDASNGVIHVIDSVILPE